ncbi:MAG: hypothetical protein GXP45_07215 [bacterium]|nr:hypothetical protein [bacterium]
MFYSCSGTDETEVYGQLKHTLNEVDYYLIAGTDYNFSNNSYNNTFSGTLDIVDNKLTGFIFDSV